MKSGTAKVLHPVLGTPLLGHVLRETSALRPRSEVVVVGHQRERVGAYVQSSYPEVLVAVQDEQLGTGHAVRCALDQVAQQGIELGDGTVVVTAGDTPLLTAETLAGLLDEHDSADAAATVLSARIADPSGYGRIVRDDSGAVIGIVEHKDASERELAIDEINSGVYAFRASGLENALHHVSTDNAQGEQYLTDVLGILRSAGETVTAHVADDADDVHGINDRVQLAEAERIMAARINRYWMRQGVSIPDPHTVWISPEATFERDAVVHRNTAILGASFVGEGAEIGPDTTLLNCRIGAGAQVLRSHCDHAAVGAEATVGPFTFLRPGTALAAGAKAGAYVEIKNASVGEGAKVPHLSYVGDADIGPGTNIGAATVFVNYDGVDKHRTVVGANVRVGSDSMLVAPVEIGDGAYTGAGSVITEDVPPGALALGRARQRNIEGWVAGHRAGTPSADAASAAESGLPDGPGGSAAESAGE